MTSKALADRHLIFQAEEDDDDGDQLADQAQRTCEQRSTCASGCCRAYAVRAFVVEQSGLTGRNRELRRGPFVACIRWPPCDRYGRYFELAFFLSVNSACMSFQPLRVRAISSCGGACEESVSSKCRRRAPASSFTTSLWCAARAALISAVSRQSARFKSTSGLVVQQEGHDFGRSPFAAAAS